MIGRVFLIALAAVAATAAPAAARGCGQSYLPDGYVNSMQTKHVSCATGRKVAKAHRACRHEHGIKGHCTHKVRGYACREGKRYAIPTQFDAKVTCTKGRKKVVFVYEQDTA